MLIFSLITLQISHAVSETLRAAERLQLYTKNFYELPGTGISLKGTYEVCKLTYCPNCIRVLYLKFGETSTCLGQRTPNKLLNCWPYNFIAKVKVPTINGVYNITAYSVLEYRCSAVPDYEGVVIGTIHVGNPLFWIDGNNNFTSSPGRAITVRGCYKYCKQILLLPRMSTSSILSRDGRFNLLCC